MLGDQRGQVFLIVLLVTVIALTIGLSVASRNIVSLRTSREEKDSQRALAAAEAGIERSLQTGSGIGPSSFIGFFVGGVTYSSSVNSIAGTDLLANGGRLVPKDEGADIWLIPHDPATKDPDLAAAPWNGSVTIYWGDVLGSCVNAALELAVIWDDPLPGLTPTLTRYAFDPCAARAIDNNFTPALSGFFSIAGEDFSYSTTPILISQGLLVRAVPLYKTAEIGVSGGAVALPPQGIVVEGIGTAGETTRKLSVFRGYPQVPIQYFYGLFSP